MAIKIWDYLKEYELEKKEIHRAIEDVLSSGWLILGNKVKEFEEEFSSWCGSSYGIGVNSGTDALFLSFKALNIGPGDEVITVSNTAVPTVSAITSTGAKAVFVDINPDTYLMDENRLEYRITAKTKCIVPVHLYGQCANMDEINAIAKKHNLFVIEDCAQSHGAEFKGKKSGSMSDIAAFSFYPTKILGAFGDGGMIITKNPELYEKIKRLRFYGMEKTYYSIEQGYNSRLDEMQASILLNKLTHLDKYIERRRHLAKQYDEHLKGSTLILPFEAKDRKHAYYLYVVRHQERDLIIEELKKKEIFVNISYPWPIHTMSGFINLGYSEGDLPITEKLSKEIFSLPLYPTLTDNEQEMVIDALLEILNKFHI